MRFTLKQLRHIGAAGRLGSIANAATKLSISQSSIAAAIDGLEDKLGFDIFLRTPAKGSSRLQRVMRRSGQFCNQDPHEAVSGGKRRTRAPHRTMVSLDCSMSKRTRSCIPQFRVRVP